MQMQLLLYKKESLIFVSVEILAFSSGSPKDK